MGGHKREQNATSRFYSNVYRVLSNLPFSYPRLTIGDDLDVVMITITTGGGGDRHS